MEEPEARFIEHHLKKQSQFSKGRMGVSIYMKGYYEEFYAFGLRKNKANSKPNSIANSAKFVNEQCQ